MNLQESYQKYKTLFYECLKNDGDIKYRMMETPSSYLTMIRNSMIEMLNEFEDANNDSFIISNEKIPYINRYAGFINIITGDIETKGHKVIHQNISQHYKNQMARFMLFDGIYGRNVYISYIDENGIKQAYKLLKKKFNDLEVDCYIIDVSDGTDKDNFVKTFVYDSKGKEYDSDVLELGKDVPWLRNYLNEYLGNNMASYDEQINEVLKLAGVQLNESEDKPIYLLNDNFRTWFGNSKVVDSNGNPLVVYHGSYTNIDKFDKRYAGETTANNEAEVFYFTSDKESAIDYSKESVVRRSETDYWDNEELQNEKTWDEYVEEIRENIGNNPHINPCFLRIENPYVYDNDYQQFDYFKFYTLEMILQNRIYEISGDYYEKYMDDFVDLLDIEEFNFDGIIIKNVIDDIGDYHDAINEYIVWNPLQIKSVKNKGNWSLYNEDVNETLYEAGYQGYSKSNNAIEAESEGRFPASVAAKKLGVSTEAIRENIPTSEWHHYSNHYNQVYVYDITPYLMLKNGEDMSNDYDEDEINEYKEVYAQMKAMSKPKKDDGKKYRANVDYIEWAGSMKHPKANKHHYENIKVLETGQFYTFYLPNGEEVRKKIGSNGTYVESMEQVKARLAKEKERAKAQKEWEKHAKLAFKEFKRNTSKNALQFLKQPFLELNSNGTHIYKNGRKPSQWDYDNLSKFFKQGELRCSSKYSDGLSNAGVYLEQWNGEKWVSIEETSYNVETGIFYLGLNFIQKQLGVEYK